MFRNIVVGLSGGVDSAVAALLLKRKGFNVTAVFLRNWDTADETGKCWADEEYKDAETIAKKLDIPLIELNFVKDYWNEVFSYLLESYEAGITPNPDIMCNKKIKFDIFYDYAMNNLGADAVATGHYARTSFGSFLEDFKPDAKAKLLLAKDTRKDQTFFLSQVQQKPLQRWMFPLSNYEKTEVKEIAKQAGLERIAAKSESMGICFIGSRTFRKFIPGYLEDKPGNFIDYDSGKIVGEHRGIHYWTIGQRARICGFEDKLFIYQKNLSTNDILVVRGTNHPALFTRLLVTSTPHWIHDKPEALVRGNLLECQFRFQNVSPIAPCRVFNDDKDQLTIDLEVAQRAISPGQFAVLYSGEECLGSAPILYPGPSLYSLGEISPEIVYCEENRDVAVHNV